MECPYINHPEWSLTGELYFQLRKLGWDARLELLVPSYLHRSGHMRIDIGIIESEKLTHAIECKRTGKKMNGWSRQAKAYTALADRYDVTISFINDMGQFPELFKILRGQ